MSTHVPPSIELVQRTLDTIETQLSESIALEALAQEAGMSFWYFLRVFRATVGETLKDYIRRRRLTQAALTLLDDRNRTILDIALEAGFESNEAFTRAFRAQFDQAPSAFRRTGSPPGFPQAQPQITRDYLAHLQSGISREPERVNHPELCLVGPKREFAVAPEAFDILALGAPLWQQFAEQMAGVPQRADACLYFFCDILSESAEQIRATLMPALCVTDYAELPAGWCAERRPASNDAVFAHQGAGRAWEYTMHYVFGTWAAESASALSELPVLYRFDPAHSPFSTDPHLELWIGLRD
jgi:AraC family transcriptional regulator